MKYTRLKLSTLSIMALALAACGGSNDNNSGGTDTVAANVGLSSSILDESHRFDKPASRTIISVANSSSIAGNLDYTIKLVNLTNNQPLSPVLVVFHENGYQAFADGSTASTALEYMAEAGDNSFLVTEATAAAEYIAHQSTAGPVPPRSTDTVTISIPAADAANLQISVLTMLVNTNDAFSGLNAQDISGLGDGDRLILNGLVWDAGTELNTEAAGTIPGPADGGEGFNSSRDDIVNAVRIHQGVVTNALAGGLIVR